LHRPEARGKTAFSGALHAAAAILAVAIVNLLEKRFVRWRGES